MRIYVAERTEADVRCDVHSTNNEGQYCALHPLTLIGLHSPTGFNVGYGGSGPSELALCILADYFGEDPVAIKRGDDTLSYRYHQNFKWKFITPPQLDNGDQLTITEEEIGKWLDAENVANPELARKIEKIRPRKYAGRL